MYHMAVNVKSDEAAGAILETVPSTMRLIREHMRAGRAAGLSVAQFRLLLFVRRNPATSLSAAADHLGTTLPSASQLVDRLVRSGLLSRLPSAQERRRVELRLTDAGQGALAECDARTRAWLRERLDEMTEPDLERLTASLHELRAVLSRPPRPGG
jgi:DNA-binding MarR family transcriptional regulator